MAALRNRAIEQVVIVGGTQAVSGQVFAEVAALDIIDSVERMTSKEHTHTMSRTLLQRAVAAATSHGLVGAVGLALAPTRARSRPAAPPSRARSTRRRQRHHRGTGG